VKKHLLIPILLWLLSLGQAKAISDVVVEIDQSQDLSGTPVTTLIVNDPLGRMLARHQDVYVQIYEQTPDWFPYLVVEESTGGSGCCITHYFYDKRGNFKNPTVMSNSSVFLRLMKSGEGFFVYSATGQSVVLK
jgi:hypothetical protein